MRKGKLWAAPTLVAAFALILTGCSGSGSGDGEATDDPIVIGIASSQTGYFSEFDIPVKNAIELAVADLNAKGGILDRRIEVVVSDSKSEVDLSASAAIEVLDEGADVVVPSCDYNLGAPAAQEAQAQGKLAISCAGSALFGPVGVGPLAFTINESSELHGSIGAEFAFEQGWQNVYLLNDSSTDFTTSWCSAFKETFEGLGGTVVGEDTFATGDTTAAAQISRLVSSGGDADVIALCGYPPTGTTVLGQLRSADVMVPIMTTSGFDGPGWIDAVPNVADVYAMTSASIFGDDPRSAINDLVETYTDKHEAPSSAYPALGYAMLEVIAGAMEAAGSTDGAAIAEALHSPDGFETIVGTTSYTEGCHAAIDRPVQILSYSNGAGAWEATASSSTDILPDGCS